MHLVELTLRVCVLSIQFLRIQLLFDEIGNYVEHDAKLFFWICYLIEWSFSLFYVVAACCAFLSTKLSIVESSSAIASASSSAATSVASTAAATSDFLVATALLSLSLLELLAAIDQAMAVFVAEVVPEINTLCILDCISLNALLSAVATSSSAAATTPSTAAIGLLRIIRDEAEKRICLDFLLFALFVLHFDVRAKFILRSECHEAFCFANLIRANEMRQGEVGLQACVVLVIDVLVVVRAQVARQVIAAEMFKKLHIIEEEFFAEVAIRMWQYLAELVVPEVTLLDVSAECIYVVQSLLPNKHRSSFQTNLTECLFMASF